MHRVSSSCGSVDVVKGRESVRMHEVMLCTVDEVRGRGIRTFRQSSYVLDGRKSVLTKYQDPSTPSPSQEHSALACLQPSDWHSRHRA